MKKIMILISLMTLLLVGSTSLFAQKADCEMGHSGKQMEMKKEAPMNMKDQLKLTADQEKKMDVLKADHQKEMIKFRADLKTKEIDKRQALKNEDYTTAKKITSEIAKIEESIALKRIDMHKAISDLLTKEQKEILKNNPEMLMGMNEGPRMDQKGDCGMHKGGDQKMNERNQKNSCK